MAACRYNALCVNFRQSFQIGILLEAVAAEDILNGIQDFVIAVRSKYGVNLRNLLNDFIAVALPYSPLPEEPYSFPLYGTSPFQEYFECFLLWRRG